MPDRIDILHRPAYHEITIKIRVPFDAGEEIGITLFSVPLLHKLRALLGTHIRQAYQAFRRSGPEMPLTISYETATLTWRRDLVAADGTVLDRYPAEEQRPSGQLTRLERTMAGCLAAKRILRRTDLNPETRALWEKLEKVTEGAIEKRLKVLRLIRGE